MGVETIMNDGPRDPQSAVSEDSATEAAVSVVVPVKSSHATIRRLCESLLHQTVPPLEIILVGDPDDSTWIPIRDLIDGRRLRTIEVTRPAHHYGRDSNLKRRAGCDAACGGIIAVTDSDMVLPKDWLKTGIEILQSNAVDSVAGIILSRPQTDRPAEDFLDRYTDRSLLSKTPRFTEGVVVDKGSFGRHQHLPISANWFFTRKAYERSGGFDPSFTLSYEDYSFAWQMVSAGHRILCTNQLVGYHCHRHRFAGLIKEYVKSGRGCAMFMWRYPASPLTRRRLAQLLALGAVVVLTGVALLRWPSITLVVALSMLFSASLLNLRAAGRPGLLFPPVSLILGSAFTYGAIRGLVKGGRACPKDQYYTNMHPRN
jgi:GT2 family glycosyltransferase